MKVNLEQLNLIKEMMPLDELNENQVKELQSALTQLDFKIGEIDGLLGVRTKNAWAEFKSDFYSGNPDLIGVESIEKLKECLDDKVLDNNGLVPTYDLSSKEKVISAIVKECKRQGIGLNTQIAYVLGSVEWETGQTFKPVKEGIGKTDEWRKKNFRYFPYFGRGAIQMTHLSNYQKYSKILGIDLVNKPDLALDPQISLFILVHGFKNGTFTGRKITDYINVSRTDFISARRCINGTDKASVIANLAKKYLKLLNSGDIC